MLRQLRLRQPGRRDERGSSLVEFALLAPVLLMLLVGILEFGRVLDAWLIVSNAAREGARYGAVGSDATEIKSRTLTYLTNGVGGRTDVGLPTVDEIVVTNARGVPGAAVAVRAPLRIWLFTPLVQGMLPANPVTLRATVTMRIQ